jgi:hypothetical protein
MKKSKLFMGILGITLVFGTLFLACPNDTSEEQDSWSAITGLDQLDGTWKGSYSETKSIKEFSEESGQQLPDETAAALGDMKVTVSVEITTTINAAGKTQAMSQTMTISFSGGNIDAMWEMIKGGMGNIGTADDDAHSVTITVPAQEPQQISDEDLAGMKESLQINQNGTKVKIPAGFMGEESPEIILSKQ